MRSAIISTLTKDCRETTCRIEDQGSRQTLLGGIPTYDKDGKPISKNLNPTKTAYFCRSCGQSWTVTTQDGATPVIEKHS